MKQRGTSLDSLKLQRGEKVSEPEFVLNPEADPKSPSVKQAGQKSDHEMQNFLKQIEDLSK